MDTRAGFNARSKTESHNPGCKGLALVMVSDTVMFMFVSSFSYVTPSFVPYCCVKILGIETSCDETSAAVVEDGHRIVSNIVASQIDIHAKFGGVVPEVASRRHVELILPTISEALAAAGCALADIDCIGVINRPGLIGALIVGAAAAKTIAFAAGKPLVTVHHLEAHIYANWLVDTDIEFPVVCLVVSGGHSDLVLMTGHGQYRILARTRDDAAGEAFDKCARAMGLGYPGGPLIDKLARQGNPRAVDFPRARVGDTLDFSFSGLRRRHPLRSEFKRCN